MQSNRPNINEGKPWSEMDLVDLRNSVAHGTPVAEIPDFLRRSEREFRRRSPSSGCRREDPKPDQPTADDAAAIRR